MSNHTGKMPWDGLFEKLGYKIKKVSIKTSKYKIVK